MSPVTGRKPLNRASLVQKEWTSFLLITFGTLLYALGILTLTIPFRFPDSGVAGIAVLSKYIWKISPAWVVVVTNAILLTWGWKKLSARFVLWTLYTAALLAFLLKVGENIPAIPLDMKTEALLAAILSGVIKGLGNSMIFRARSSLGGTDVIVVALRERYGIEVGKFTFYINVVILGISLPIVGLQGAIYGLLSIYTNALITDSLLQSFDRRKQVMIITENHDLVSNYIMSELHRGVTYFPVEGAYTGRSRNMIWSLLSTRQSIEVKRFLMESDPSAFMVVSDASEVLGKGFKPWKAV